MLKAMSLSILLYCCLDNWTVLSFSIIVLATVEPLYNDFALSSDDRYLYVYFWIFLGMVFHARSKNSSTWYYLSSAELLITPYQTGSIFVL